MTIFGEKTTALLQEVLDEATTPLRERITNLEGIVTRYEDALDGIAALDVSNADLAIEIASDALDEVRHGR